MAAASHLNVDSLKLESKISFPTKKKKLPRHKTGEMFLKGPIPWCWLSTAAQLRGKALHVGIALWWWAGMTKNATIKLSISKLKTLGLGRYSAYRALRALEDANLVSVDRRPGRKPVVTILEVGQEVAPGPLVESSLPETKLPATDVGTTVSDDSCDSGLPGRETSSEKSSTGCTDTTQIT